MRPPKCETNPHLVSFSDYVLNGLMEIGVALAKRGYELLVFFYMFFYVVSNSESAC